MTLSGCNFKWQCRSGLNCTFCSPNSSQTWRNSRVSRYNQIWLVRHYRKWCRRNAVYWLLGIDCGWRSKIRCKNNWRFRFLTVIISVPNTRLEYQNQEMNKKEMERKTSKSRNSPQYVMKSTLGDGFDDGDRSGKTELNSNFPDMKPSRPTFYKKEFKKLREGLQLDGEVIFLKAL